MNHSNNYNASSTLNQVFFAPLLAAANLSPCLRRCLSLPDLDWLKLGIQRVIGNHPSGRSLLQSALSLFCAAPSHQLWFESLKSSRRLKFCRDTATRLFTHGTKALDHADVLRELPALKDFEVLAGDGHFISHACHDLRLPSSEGTLKHYPTGHFYLLDLRRHLMLGDQQQRKKEYYIRAIKRAGVQALREGIPAGRKAIVIWDPAGIDFKLWHDYKQQHGIYFISRSKDNLAFMRCGQRTWDHADAINHGVQSDEQVGSGTKGYFLRKVTYTDPQSQSTYEFITNELTLPPGILALLYRMRWDIEPRRLAGAEIDSRRLPRSGEQAVRRIAHQKVFDELKNKLQQTKAWASSATAKQIQAQFICLTHNLMRLLEQELAAQGICDERELKRRAHSHGVELPKARRAQGREPDRRVQQPLAKRRQQQKKKKKQEARRSHWPQSLREWLLEPVINFYLKIELSMRQQKASQCMPCSVEAKRS